MKQNFRKLYTVLAKKPTIDNKKILGVCRQFETICETFVIIKNLRKFWVLSLINRNCLFQLLQIGKGSRAALWTMIPFFFEVAFHLFKFVRSFFGRS
jgi:hypothetical protein